MPRSGFALVPLRAFSERDAVHFEFSGPTSASDAIAFGLIILVALVYGGIAVVLGGDGPPWWVHALMAVLLLICTTAVAMRWQFTRQFKCATLSRVGDAVDLRCGSKRGNQRTFRFSGDMRLEIALDRSMDVAGSIRHDTDDNGTVRYNDQTEITFVLYGNRVEPMGFLFGRRWRVVAPPIQLHFTKHDEENNLAASLEAVQPIAEAVHTTLRIPVRICLTGGPILLHLDPPTTY